MRFQWREPQNFFRTLSTLLQKAAKVDELLDKD